MNNVYKALQNCLVLKAFTDCDSLGEIRIECADCTTDINSSGKKFCAAISKDSGGKSFKACVSVDLNTTPNTVVRTYGGGI